MPSGILFQFVLYLRHVKLPSQLGIIKDLVGSLISEARAERALGIKYPLTAETIASGQVTGRARQGSSQEAIFQSICEFT